MPRRLTHISIHQLTNCVTPIDFSAGIAWFGAILNRVGPLVEIGPRSVFANSIVGIRQ